MKMAMLNVEHRTRLYLALLGISTMLIALMYVTSQQNLRQGANMPQVQVASDTARKIVAGGDPKLLVAGDDVPMNLSLAPFTIIYDENMNVVAGNGRLDDTTPKPPIGTFESTRSHRESRFTWAPRSDTRIAAVMVHIDREEGGFVLSGRSLVEVERIDQSALYFASFAWAVIVLGLLILFFA